MKASAVSTLALALGLLCTVQATQIISSEKRGECPQRISWCDRPPPHNHTCNNDYDCDGTQKCCIEVCTKECRNTVPVKLKPGVCPEDPNGCHKIEDDECYGDNHCPGDQKCCVFHCGLKCKNVTAAAVKPKPKPKPGQCPEDNIRCIVAEADECTSDRNCTGDQKCCHFHCGLKCMNATAAPEKSGSCPLPPMLPACIFPAPPTNECATDQECQDDQKCCDAGCSPQCRKPLQDKSGHCPPFNSSICKTARPLPGTCSNDSQCEGTERCCCHGNCRMECTATVKSGTCPAAKLPCTDYSTLDNCTDDGDCEGRKKCCEGCGKHKHCTSPDPGQLNSCPSYDRSICALVDAAPDECQKDSECSETQHCCCSNCRRACTPKVKPGTCPATKLPCTDYSTPDNCTDDGDCEGRQKCCEGCGKHKRCRSPDPVKPGACPDIKASCLLPLQDAECKDDLDCGGVKKCCKLCGNQCMNPASVAPGSCPGMKAKCDPEKLARECKADDDCDPKEKCCELCGKQCLPAVSDHAGFCPVSRFHILILCTPNNTVVNCSRDLDCPPDEKCCTSVCKTGCVKPLQEKTGECPAAKPDQPTANEPLDIFNKCNDDKDCTGDFKCCPGSKGKECIQPMIIV